VVVETHGYVIGSTTGETRRVAAPAHPAPVVPTVTPGPAPSPVAHAPGPATQNPGRTGDVDAHVNQQLMEWRYLPTLVNGKAIASCTDVTVAYRIQD
jgi:hypothetical protein